MKGKVEFMKKVNAIFEMMSAASISGFFGKTVYVFKVDGKQIKYNFNRFLAGNNPDMHTEGILTLNDHDDFISFVTPQEFKKSKNRFHREINKNNIMGHIREKEAMLGNRPNAIWYRRSHWDSLCVLCLADADAQSLLVKQNGKVIDSRKHKQAKIAKIRSIIAALSC